MQRFSNRFPLSFKNVLATGLVLLTALPLEVLAAPAAGTQVASPAAAPKPAKPIDVSLSAEGLLFGQVVDAQGKPKAKAQVALYGRGGKPVVAVTNAQGAFAYQGVSSGVFQLQSSGDSRVCRVWGKKGAPPAAGNAVLLVAKSPTIRGQHQPPAYVNNAVVKGKKLFANPLAVAGIVATAVAIPVAIANDDDDAPSS